KQHPRILNLKFKPEVKRPDKDNAIDLIVRNDTTEDELNALNSLFEVIPEKFTIEEKREWLKGLNNVTLGSDAFFPFRDNIDRAFRSGVKYIVQPGGSIREDIVIEACNQYGMVMCLTGLRLFHH
ncbi:MAG: phosphoribosylaminoimidazolecarboxamide formyltransferase, partial [Clostridiaceae bacterium]|nr:phosphoribosylaminoimidazolecarboxamide formyltransferase [Clostridiaceae bacterium]